MTVEQNPDEVVFSKRGVALNVTLFDLLLVLVLVAGAFFRFSGLFWGEYNYLHPDERFLLQVGSSITPVVCSDPNYSDYNCPPESKRYLSLSEYFDTANSPLNPHNRGATFYVYGTLPMFIARLAVEWVFGHSGWVEMTQVGRTLSALFDLLVVLLVYLTAERLFDRRVAILAAAFSAAAVLQIQQSHFFTTDTFINFFALLTFYFAARIVSGDWAASEQPAQALQAEREGYALGDSPYNLGFSAQARPATALQRFLQHPLFLPCLAFGIALGMAVASKLNAAPVAVVLPIALGLRLMQAPPGERQGYFNQAVVFTLLAAVVSLVTFRILQPYAFSGPGFFNISLNPQWLSNLRELAAQTSGEVDFPPAMQWARRGVTFSGKNLILWGLGLPLGLLAFGGLIWAGWRLLHGWNERGRTWQHTALLWSWTVMYFTWQSLGRNPTMRYQLPIYPMLAIFAGWALVELWDLGARRRQASGSRRPGGLQWAALLAGALVLLGTYAYAYGFSQIYTRPITRVEASRWMFANIPGPINLHIETGEGELQQPLPFSYSTSISAGYPYTTSFQPRESGLLTEVYLPHVGGSIFSQEPAVLSLVVSAQPLGEDLLASAEVTIDPDLGKDPLGQPYTFTLDQPVQLNPEQTYYLTLHMPASSQAVNICGPIDLHLQGETDTLTQTIQQPPSCTLEPGIPYQVNFTAQADGVVRELTLQQALDLQGTPEAEVLRFSLYSPDDPSYLATAELSAELPDSPQEDAAYVVSLDQPVPFVAGNQYTLLVELVSESGGITLRGAGVANEGEWDDGLPLRMDGYDPFGGLYPPDLNFNMYWDDNPDKLNRFLTILDQAEYVVISSSRQWGSLPRIPERFPLVTTYYRHLIGCPDDREIEWCYNVAQPGMFQGELGFELIEVFESSPQIGPLRLNDQFAEEAFTVYDHPKVFIFRKTGAYDPEKVASILGSVDFSKVIRRPPMQFDSYPADLMLPLQRWVLAQTSGTWSQLFDTGALFNRWPALSAVLWYVALFALGLLVYPFLRLALPGLPDRGYALARSAGLLVLSYLVWLAGSLGVVTSRLTISAVLGIMLLVGLALAFYQRGGLREDLRRRAGYFLTVEGLFLALFVFDLLIRLGNPDLWHPWKGGEKPMDFAYFNAILKSPTFPPYDPWFAGGYLNYYYYGFVFVGVLVKWLGIVPAVAYNLIIPTLFALIGIGAFGIAYNLYRHWQMHHAPDSGRGTLHAGWVGLSGALGMVVLGNLGNVKLLYENYLRAGSSGAATEGTFFLVRWLWALRGFIMSLTGARMEIPLDQWYWNASRVMPPDDQAITEFPFFSILYGDPHAHVFSMAIAPLALGFAIAFVLGRGRWKGILSAACSFLFGGLAISALRPTNTWDFYPYLALAVVAVLYTLLANAEPAEGLRRRLPVLRSLPQVSLRLVTALLGVVVLVTLVELFFKPYTDWYGLGYGEVGLWEGPRTPLSSYFVHWGLFLFVIASWLVWESVEWMSSTPVSALNSLRPHKGLLQAAGLLVLAAVGALLLYGVSIGWVVVLLGLWAAVLLLRPGQPESKRVVLFLTGTALAITLMVELVVLKGDIGRMNTVFKFYLQAWTLLAVSAAACLGWLLTSLHTWEPALRRAWQVGVSALVLGAALYTLTASMAKIEDRMVPSAPHTLDGMRYMAYARYDWEGPMDLSQDYQAIRWMQENVEGSPVIVEANLRDLYRWGSRFTIYTGLPGVVGWEWHQQQQRAVVPASWVSERIAEISDFYLTTDFEYAYDFLEKYNVRYIIVGQLERNHYPGPGLDKFPAGEGKYWRTVFQYQDTTIYEVLDRTTAMQPDAGCTLCR